MSKSERKGHQYWIKKTIRLAKRSLPLDVPVGALLIDSKSQEIISCGFNLREKKQEITAHAELIALSRACQKLNTYNLSRYILYSSLEPCLMCLGAIIQSKIPEIIFAAYQEEQQIKILDTKTKLKLTGGILEQPSKELIQTFFREKRKRKKEVKSRTKAFS